MDRKIVLKQDILGALSAVGMRVGQTVMVHCSLSALGYVRGGAQPVIEALLQTVGETGTVMMPTPSWKNRRYAQSRRLFRTPHGGDTLATSPPDIGGSGYVSRSVKQLSVGLTMGRSAISIALAVVCLAVLLGATGLFAISRETSYMQECASEGFAIDGYYRDDKTSRETLAFLEEDNCRWQLVDQDGICTDGQFKRTDDPNILILKKENGEEFGTVHVAYMSRRREQGQLYLFRDTRVTRFYLVSTGPAFTVESGDVDPDS